MGKSSCLAAVSLQWVASGHSAHHNNDQSLPGAPAAAEQFSAQAVRLLCEHRSAFTLISQDTRTIPHMCKFHLDIQLFLMGGSLALIGFIPCSQPLSCPFPESQGLLCQRLTASSKHGLAPRHPTKNNAAEMVNCREAGRLPPALGNTCPCIFILLWFFAQQH